MQKNLTPISIINRTALPMMLFFAVFAGMLFVSKTFLLPSLLIVEINGEKHSVEKIQSYYSMLLEDFDEKQKQRTKLVLPMEGTVYRAILDEKNQAYTTDFLISSILQITNEITFMQNVEDAFELNNFEYSPYEHSLRLVGNVYKVGPRSMTVLAQFIEELRNQPFIKNMEYPAFNRKEDSDGNFYSPFDIYLSLE